MPAPGYCSVCSHEDALEINEKLILDRWSNRRTATHYGSSEPSMRRHKEHIPALLARVAKRENLAVAEEIVEEIKNLKEEARDILIEARDIANSELALKAMARIESQLELQSKVLQIIKTQPQINILSIPEVAQSIEVMGRALDPFPDAQIALAAALLEIEDGM